MEVKSRTELSLIYTPIFSGIFRGVLDNGVKKITDEMKLQSAKNLAALVKKPVPEKIIPGAFDKGVTATVAKAMV